MQKYLAASYKKHEHKLKKETTVKQIKPTNLRGLNRSSMVGALSVVFTVCFRSAAAAQNYAIRLFHTRYSKWRRGWGFSPRAQAMTSALTRQPTELLLLPAARAALTEHVPSVSNAISHKPSSNIAHNPIPLRLTEGWYENCEIKAFEARSPRTEIRCIGNTNHFNQHLKMDVCSVTVLEYRLLLLLLLPPLEDHLHTS